jgi:hypothetical protein
MLLLEHLVILLIRLRDLYFDFLALYVDEEMTLVLHHVPISAFAALLNICLVYFSTDHTTYSICHIVKHSCEPRLTLRASRRHIDLNEPEF